MAARDETGTAGSGATHRENYDALKERAEDLVREAYRVDAPWQLRDLALPLVIDLAGELGACVLELELLRADMPTRPGASS